MPDVWGSYENGAVRPLRILIERDLLCRQNAAVLFCASDRAERTKGSEPSVFYRNKTCCELDRVTTRVAVEYKVCFFWIFETNPCHTKSLSKLCEAHQRVKKVFPVDDDLPTVYETMQTGSE